MPKNRPQNLNSLDEDVDNSSQLSLADANLFKLTIHHLFTHNPQYPTRNLHFWSLLWPEEFQSKKRYMVATIFKRKPAEWPDHLLTVSLQNGCAGLYYGPYSP